MDSEFKKIVDKQKSSWECSACLNRNDASKSKCACCDQSRDITKGSAASEAAPAKSQFSFGSNITAPKTTFSFGAIPSTATSVGSTFSFGNLAAKPNTQTSFSFGSIKDDAPITSSTNNDKSIDVEKAKDTTEKPSSSAQFSFGNSTVLPSTSKTETIPKPAAPVASDNIFKSIVDKQKNSTWECTSCLTKNSNDKEKCACCETLKDGSTAKSDSGKKDFGLTSSSSTLSSSNQKFSFGAPASSTFSFGSQPITESKPTFQFGGSTNSTTVVSSTTSTTTTTAPAFGSGTQTSMFTFSANKPVNETSSTLSAAPLPSSGFQFSFGSSNNSATTSNTEMSKDVTDTGATSNTTDKGITILDNVLVKPATNGPNEPPKPLFAFGQSVTNQSIDNAATNSKKRSNTDLNEGSLSAKLPAAPSTSFIFGQPPTTNNTFGAIISSPASSTTQDISAPTISAQEPNTSKPTFSFGMTKPTTNAFPTAQPTFSSTSFSFGSGSTATTTPPSIFGAVTSTPAVNSPSQPTFGSNTFSATSSTMPTLGGFKSGTTFGSSAPAFGTPSLNTEVSIFLFFVQFEYLLNI